MLLACAHVHNTFKRRFKRSKFDIVIESAEPREPHHFACLFGYGASAINPYMVNEIIEDQVNKEIIKGLTFSNAVKNYNKAVAKGIIKVMNKIGISTLHSYRGAQIFEALGLGNEFIERFFCNTPSRIEGVGLNELENEIEKRFKKAFSDDQKFGLDLEIGGEYRWRRDGEAHMLIPS